MNRITVLSLALVACGWGASAAVSAADSPRAHLRLYRCQRAVDPLQRSISVDAVMRPLAETKKMEVRFDLLSQARRGGPWTLVQDGGLPWQTPGGQPPLGQNPGDVWSVIDTDRRLPAPATYRYRVTFRWTLANRRSTRTLFSPKCAQAELRPDLEVASITVASIAGKPNLERYTALIRNGGVTAAGPFQVVFAPPAATHAASKAHRLDGLGPHATAIATFVGPACTASTAPTVSVVPGRVLDDYNQANNSLVASCPAATPGG